MEQAKIWEANISIPTYGIGKPEKNPMFIGKRVYQGSSGRVYPYPVIESIDDTKTDKVYHAVFLENRYLKIMILPELGGRIQRAYDKTNGYDFVYYNHVIKPALVGLLGPWISGGIEFNWPQHHRPTTFMPVDHVIRENADGSVTCLLGDTDRMYGTKGICAISLYPDRAYIEIRGQLYNRTDLPQTFLWWANPAVPVNNDTQTIMPPDVHAVMDHGKRDVSRFPIATGTYYKHDYSEGVDISRYKNIPVPTSFMAASSHYDFVGGYDWGREAGILHVADHHISPGKKQWTWGCGDFGKAWDRNLTDADGPYVELMTGVFTDNQPDFTWLEPSEEKNFLQYFMPYKRVGVVKNATKDAAVGLEFGEADSGGNGRDSLPVTVRAYGTGEFAQVQIRILVRGKCVAEDTAALSPEKPYEHTFRLLDWRTDAERTGADWQHDVRAEIRDGAQLLVAYQPEKEKIDKLPEPARAALPPAEIRTNEELYLTGLHLEQYRHATYLPEDYYLEGLKRDPGDSRINLAYGCLLMRCGAWVEAEPYLRKAKERLTWRNPNPYDGEVFYDLGLCLFLQERYAEAYDMFWKGTWSAAWQAQCFYYLALLDVRAAYRDECVAAGNGRSGAAGSVTAYRKRTGTAAESGRKADRTVSAGTSRLEHALTMADQSLVRNAHAVHTLALRALILRRLGRTKEALEQTQHNLALDPFDYQSLYEQVLLAEQYGMKLPMLPVSQQDVKGLSEPGSTYTAGSGSRSQCSGNTSAVRCALRGRMREDLYTALRLSQDYARAGLYEEAAGALDLASDADQKNPLLLYYRGYYAQKQECSAESEEYSMEDSTEKGSALSGNTAAGKEGQQSAGQTGRMSARQYYAAADAADPYLCFPNSLWDILVLESAIRVYPEGAKAYYYLGCLYMDKHGWEKSQELWEKSAALDPSYPTVWRNLSLVYFNKRHEADKARDALERAYALDPSDARVFMELDQLHKKTGWSYEKRLAEYEKRPDVFTRRDDLCVEYCTLLNVTGQPEKALEFMQSRRFHPWEGGEGRITTQYEFSHVLLAGEAMRKAERLQESAAGTISGNGSPDTTNQETSRIQELYQDAAGHLRAALSYPENLGEGKLEGTRDNHIHYYLGVCAEQLGRTEEAVREFTAASQGTDEPAGMMYYNDQPADMILYQGLALEKLGRKGAANARFCRLLDYGEQHRGDHVKIDYFAVSLPDLLIFEDDLDVRNQAHCDFLMAMGWYGMGENNKAAHFFGNAVAEDPSNFRFRLIGTLLN